MCAPSPSRIAAARIPKITDLRDQLGYGDAKLARCIAFTDDLRVFRRRYSSMGLQGTHLWDWKSAEHQAALRQMTASFLDENGYGEVYWPSDPTSPNFNSLQYSKDRTFITQNMRQLIFRLNLQQYRNNKYKKKENQPDADIHEIIDLEAEESPIHLARPNFPNINTETPSRSSTAHTSTETRPSVPSTFTDPGSLHSEFDVYDVPTTSDSEPEPRATKRKLNAPRGSKPPKRSKIVCLKVPIGKASIPKPGQATPKAKWTSPRARKTVQRPNLANVSDLDQAIASQTVTAESITSPSDDIGAGHQTSIRQGYEHVDDVLNYIGTNTRAVTYESVPPTSTMSTHDSHIDPNLERIVSLSSAVRQPRPGCASSPSSVNVDVSNTIQPKPQSFPPSALAVEQAHETLRKTSASPAPLPVSEPAQTLLNQGVKAFPTTPSTPVAASSTPSKSSIDFNYIVILSRTPVYQYKTWKSRGHFLEKSLSELVTELPFDNKKDVIGLKIRLQGPGVAGEETLNCAEDAKFDTTKSRFLRMVKMCLRNHTKTNPGRTLVMNFEIEAVREGSVEEEGGVEEEDDDDEDIVF